MPTPLSLFDKLDTVQITPTQNLNHSDQTAINQHQHAYHHALQQTRQLNDATTPLEGQGEWLDRQVKTIRRAIEDARRDEAHNFVRRVTSYFASAYNITVNDHALARLVDERLKEEDRDTSQPVIAADEITNHVLEQLNGKSFYDVAVEELKAKFRQRLYRGAHPKGRTVRLEHFLYLEERYSGNGMRLAYGSSDHWLLLQRILSHFENPSITSALPVITTAMPVPFHHDLDPVRDYDFPNCQRINGATVYKNGNVALKFPTNELALEFCRTFDLTT